MRRIDQRRSTAEKSAVFILEEIMRRKNYGFDARDKIADEIERVIINEVNTAMENSLDIKRVEKQIAQALVNCRRSIYTLQIRWLKGAMKHKSLDAIRDTMAYKVESLNDMLKADRARKSRNRRKK